MSAETIAATRPTWRNIISMIRARPGLYFLHLSLWTIIHLSPLIPGLIAREFFDALSGTSGTSFGTNELIMLLVLFAIARDFHRLDGHIRLDQRPQFVHHRIARRRRRGRPQHRFRQSALLSTRRSGL